MFNNKIYKSCNAMRANDEVTEEIKKKKGCQKPGFNIYFHST